MAGYPRQPGHDVPPDAERTRPCREALKFGLTPEEAKDLRERVEDTPTGEVLPVSLIRDLRDRFGSPPWRFSDRVIRRAEVTAGRPEHGAMMSGAHVSGYEVVFERECPECEDRRAVRTYRRHHNISGADSVACESCGHTFDREVWD